MFALAGLSIRYFVDTEKIHLVSLWPKMDILKVIFLKKIVAWLDNVIFFITAYKFKDAHPSPKNCANS